VAELHAARIVDGLPTTPDPAIRRSVEAMLKVECYDGQSSDAFAKAIVGPDVVPESRPLAWAHRQLLMRDTQVLQNLAALRADRLPPWNWRLPHHRSHRIAAEAGIRAALWFALAAAFFVLTGWPASSAALSLVSVIIGLGAVTSDPRAITRIGLILLPVCSALGGVFGFVVLDGASDFPLLAIGLAPFVVGPALLMASSDRQIATLGRLTLVFTTSIFPPSNPQSYDPRSYVFSFILVCAAAAVLFVAQIVIPPVSDVRKKRHLITMARCAFASVLDARSKCTPPEEEMFRDAVRISQIIATETGGSAGADSVRETLCQFDRAALIRSCNDKLKKLSGGPAGKGVEDARRALKNGETDAIRAAARQLGEGRGEALELSDLHGALLALADLMDMKNAHNSCFVGDPK